MSKRLVFHLRDHLSNTPFIYIYIYYVSIYISEFFTLHWGPTWGTFINYSIDGWSGIHQCPPGETRPVDAEDLPKMGRSPLNGLTKMDISNIPYQDLQQVVLRTPLTFKNLFIETP